MYYNRSIPALIHQLNLYVNQLNADANLDPALGAYKTADSTIPNQNFYLMNLKLATLGTMINKIIGDENGKGNIVSTIIEALAAPDEQPNPNGFMAKIGFNLPAVLKALGMTGNNTVEAESFLGVLTT